MNFLDLIILLSLLWAARKGWKTGLIQSFISLVGLVLSYGLALRYGNEAVGWWTRDTGELKDEITIIGFLTIFLTTLVLCYLSGRILRSLLRASPLGILDTFGGTVIGLSKGVLVLGLLTIILHTKPIHRQLPKFIDGATLVPPLQRAALVMSSGIQILFPSAQNLFQELGLRPLEVLPPPILDKITNEAGKAKKKLKYLIDESRDKLESKSEEILENNKAF